MILKTNLFLVLPLFLEFYQVFGTNEATSPNPNQKRILFQGMHASDSHIASSMPFAQRWLKEGHYIEFLETHDKPESYRYPPGINHTYIRLKSDTSYTEVLRAVWTHYFASSTFATVYLIGEHALRKTFAEHKEEMEKFLEKQYDLVVIDELFSMLGYGLALKRKQEGIPFVTMASCASTHIMAHHLALGNNFILRPGYFAHPSVRFDIENFWNRLDTFKESMADFIFVHQVLFQSAQEGVKNLGLNGFDIREIAKKTSYYFFEDLTLFNFPQPIGSETLHVGFHCPKFGEMTGQYLTHVNHPDSKGTILVAFGTNVKWEFAPINTIKVFVEALNSLTDFRIIWTYTGDEEHVKGLKSHILVTKWAPQKEILNHPKTVAFFSHGGMKSVKDTICAGVPVVFMPILAEQSLNAEMCRQSGFGYTLEKHNLTPEKLTTALRTATTRSYKKAMMRFQGFFLDRPIAALDHSTWAINRSLRLKDRYPTFKRKGMELSYREHNYLELVGALFVVLLVLVK